MSGNKRIILLIIAVHLVWIFHLFPLQSIISPEPIYNVDHPFHYYNAYAAKQLTDVSGHIWGYDPFLLAGYPCNVFSDLDNKWVEVILSYVPAAAFTYSFKLLILFAFIISPLLMYPAALNFELEEEAAAISLALSVFIWNAGRYTYIKLVNGMFSYVLVSFACIYMLSLFYRYLKRPGARNYISFVAMSALLPMIHIVGAVIGIVPVVAGYVLSIRKKFSFHLSMAAAAVLVLAANYFWIRPFVQFTDYKILVAAIPDTIGLSRFFGDLFIGVEANIGFFLLIFSIFGFRIMWKENERLKAAILGGFFLWNFFLAYFGAYNKTLLEMEPYRFHFVMFLALVLPASTTMGRMLPGFVSRVRKNKLLLALTVLFFIVLLWPVMQKQLNRSYLHCRLPREFYDAASYLKNNASPDARIMAMPFRIVFYEKNDDDTFWVMLLPILTGREVIHDLVDFHPIKNVSVFRTVFKKGIFNRSDADLARFLDTYNIGYALSWNEDPGIYLKHRIFSKLKTFGKFNIYRVNRRYGFFLKGSGKVASSYNKISVRGASRGPVVLKYHWFENLRVKPDMKIEPFSVADDPVGFIKVYNGSVRDFDIYCVY